MLTDGFHDVPAEKIAVVVTHLEMRSKAPLRGVPLPDGLSFDELNCGIDEYRALFRLIGEDWLWFDRLRLSDQELSALLHDPDMCFWTLRDGTQPKALLELDFRQAGRCKLAYFGLAPDLIGTGAGAYLMDRAIDLAWRSGTETFTLHTCTNDSPQALDFYIRSGFTPTRRQIEIAPDPRHAHGYPASAAPHVPKI